MTIYIGKLLGNKRLRCDKTSPIRSLISFSYFNKRLKEFSDYFPQRMKTILIPVDFDNIFLPSLPTNTNLHYL